MAKTIMIANRVYDELKKRKGKMSFSEIIISLMDVDKRRTGKGLKPSLGTLKMDDEWLSISKELKEGWSKWNEKSA